VQGEHPANVIRQIPDGSWISADSHWLWRGGRWVPLPAAAWPPALFWFTSAPSWFATLLVVGLIAVIPVVGKMNLYGYAIVTSRNLRAGYRVLPPANFSFIEAGAPAALLGIAWSLATFLAFLAAGGAVGAVTYQWRHDWVWTFALGFAGAATVATAVLTVYRVLLVPALELSGREGWAIFRLGRLVRHGREHWRATWYGTGVLILWALGYAAASLVAAFVPFGSIFAAIVGVPVMAAMLAVVLARFDDPPAGFTLGWANALALLAILTMTVGNVAALAQTNIKRMLAYSGIAHAGYILVALATGTPRLGIPVPPVSGVDAAVFYLIAYTFMNLGAWMVVLALGRAGEERLKISDFAGLSSRHPVLAAAMALFLLSLAGIPPTAGLMGKWLVFSAAIQQNLIPLAIIGVLNSAVSIAYYLRVIAVMYTRPAESAVPLSPVSRPLALGIAVAVIGVVVLGVAPTFTLAWVQGLSISH